MTGGNDMRKLFSDDVLQVVRGNKNMIGILAGFCKGGFILNNDNDHHYVISAWTSPYASESANRALEKELLKAYKKYYIRTLLETYGAFWG